VFPGMRRPSLEVIPKERKAIKLSLTFKKETEHVIYYIKSLSLKKAFEI